MRKKTIRDIDLSGKRVLVRVDFNTPLANGDIADDTRLQAALPTLEYLLDCEARVVVMSHLGRPKGEVDPKLSLRPVADRLSQLIGRKVELAPAVVGEDVRRMAESLAQEDVLMIENVRFHPGETKNDSTLASEYASLGDIYVDDAFGAAHRSHASVVGVAQRLPAVAGFLLEREVDVLEGLLENPERPFFALLGGAKVSDKLTLLGNLIPRVEGLVIGGAMCFTFLRSQGLEVGDSLVEEDQLAEARRLLAEADRHEAEFLLPADVAAAQEIAAGAQHQVFSSGSIPAGWKGLDIGPRTIARFTEAINEAKTVFWNGPMGVFEVPPFDRGTNELARAVADASATSVVGGGDTIAALKGQGLLDRITHVSTGGGASMQVLEGTPLPGVEALLDR